MANTILWLGRNENGQAIVWKADGFTPVRVSTAAVETALAVSDTGQMDFAQIFAAQFPGHLFVVIYIADLLVSWVYDVTEERWFEWGHWDTTTASYIPFVGTTHSFQFNTHLVGDRLTDTVYRWSLEDLTDTLVDP